METNQMSIRTFLGATLFAFALIIAASGCGGGGSKTIDAAVIPHPDAPVTPDANLNMIDAPVAGPDADCVMNPVTHAQIINACTDPSVTRIYKNPTLPLLNPDGTLPPLP